MTETEIKFTVERAEYWSSKLMDAQAACSHTGPVSRRPFTVEGYAEPTLYFYDCKCGTCGEHWTIPQ